MAIEDHKDPLVNKPFYWSAKFWLSSMILAVVTYLAKIGAVTDAVAALITGVSWPILMGIAGQDAAKCVSTAHVKGKEASALQTPAPPTSAPPTSAPLVQEDEGGM